MTARASARARFAERQDHLAAAFSSDADEHGLGSLELNLMGQAWQPMRFARNGGFGSCRDF